MTHGPDVLAPLRPWTTVHVDRVVPLGSRGSRGSRRVATVVAGTAGVGVGVLHRRGTCRCRVARAAKLQDVKKSKAENRGDRERGSDHDQNDKNDQDDQNDNDQKQDEAFLSDTKALDAQILSLALPALIALCAEPVLSIIDTGFVGRLPNAPLCLGGLGRLVALLRKLDEICG